MALETKDGVVLGATYYPPTAKKAAVPILMVHGWEGQRGEYDLLGKTIQQFGHAVLTVDLRGHGQSTRTKGDMKVELELERMRSQDLEKMVLDLEACKKFLVEKNNEGQLNIEALGLVGAGLGAIIALNWAALDWSAQRLPSLKQGQDVKAITLLSPPQSFKGVTTRDALMHPAIRKQISIQICCGDGDSRALADARRLHQALSRFRGKLPDDPEEAAEKQDLFFVPVETKLQGTQLLDKALGTIPEIVRFFGRRLVARMGEFPWAERKNPLGN